jgi:hypothetical protein
LQPKIAIESALESKSHSSSCYLRTPGLLRHPPIDPFEKIGHLSGADRHHTIGDRGPDEATPFQSLCEQARALPIMPNYFDDVTATSSENKEIAAVWITL